MYWLVGEGHICPGYLTLTPCRKEVRSLLHCRRISDVHKRVSETTQHHHQVATALLALPTGHWKGSRIPFDLHWTSMCPVFGRSGGGGVQKALGSDPWRFSPCPHSFCPLTSPSFFFFLNNLILKSFHEVNATLLLAWCVLLVFILKWSFICASRKQI